MSEPKTEQGFNLVIEGDDNDFVEVPDDLLESFLSGEETPEVEESNEEKQNDKELKTADETDELDHDKEEGDDDLPHKVQKRLKKEKWKKHEAERKAEEAERRLKEMEAELEAYRNQQAQQQIQESLTTLEQQRRETAQALRVAREEFDDDKEMELELRLQELTVEIVNAKQGKGGSHVLPSRQATGDTQTEQRETAARLANDWISRNAQYQQNKDFAGRVDEIYIKLINEEGYNPSHPKIFEELERRLQTPRNYASAVGGPARGNEGGNGGGKTDRFDPEIDGMVMRRMGKNPNDPKQRAQYIADQKRFGSNKF